MLRFVSLLSLCTLCLSLLAPGAVYAQLKAPPSASGPWDGFNLSSREGDQWRVMFSPHTTHYSYSEEHKRVVLLGAEREREDGALAGVTLFSNSFGQPSTYIFPWGKMYRDVMGYDGVFVKWTAGLLYGYRSPYENKVPLNHNGFSPGFIPGIGWESSRLQLQLNFLGNAGLMYQLSWKLSP
jgi:hypothetical protein